MQSAQEFAEMQSPAVFSLLSLLEDEEQLKSLLDSPPPPPPFSSSFSEPPSTSKQKTSPRERNQSDSERTRRHSGSERSEKQHQPSKEPLATRVIATGVAVREGPIDHDHDGRDYAVSSSASSMKHFPPHEVTPKNNSSQGDKSANTLKFNKKLKDEFKRKAVSVMVFVYLF
jgi:hypothetical protein